MPETVSQTTDRHLALRQVLADLVADGLVPKEAADKLAARPPLRARRRPSAGGHRRPEVEGPAQPAGSCCTSRRSRSGSPSKVGLPYLHVDPFKIDFAAVTKVMSSAYARALQDPAGRRHRARSDDRHLRAVRARLGGAVEAGAAARHQARRSPTRSTSRTTSSSSSTSRSSVKGATEKDKGAYSAIANFEQLVQLGQQRQARRQRPAHRPHLRLAVQLRVRAARERHPPRAAARCRQRALPHRRRAAPGLPDTDAGDGGDDEPHQGARPHGRGREAPPAGRPAEDRDAGRRAKSSCACRPCRPRSAKSW